MKDKTSKDEFDSTLKKVAKQTFDTSAVWEMLADLKYYAKDMLEGKGMSSKSPLLFSLNVIKPSRRELDKILIDENGNYRETIRGEQIASVYHYLEHSAREFSNYVHSKEEDAEYFYTHVMSFIWRAMNRIDENVVFCAAC